MKRKKWTEEEESTLLTEYSSLRSSGAIARLRTREKKFQPIADRVNAGHHLRDPSAFPFLWSWRDVSVKIQNMRHQFLNVKLKIQSSPGSFDWDHGLHLWSNLLRYRDVFGDLDLENPSTVPSDCEGIDVDGDDDKGSGGQSVRKSKRKWKKMRVVAVRVAELGEIVVRRREREAAEEEEEEQRWRRVRRLKDGEEEEREMRRRMRREEQRREEEEMDWRERLMGMQMEHEKQVMQMHADACQAQMQVLGILVRVVCQLLGPGGGGGDSIGGMAGMTTQMNSRRSQPTIPTVSLPLNW
ncbi:hypothetical protein J5N97_022188 [Dioscorea zingiberensis]|uniref:Uncharacterized protein n=1 Tax=Dioscorea zingiberensis TaxID=325984 RepID=A0A9D5CA33_9LILI|nr:hypothetical protein J5N97_022188 [Dioscorea zingiberensis]